MFERYTEKARRTIFFARYEASMFGSPYIETEHLLLGALREDKALANHFLGSHDKIEAIRRSIEQRGKRGDKIPTSVDMPLSHESRRVLAYGAEEAERLNQEHIGTPHLLLGLLREEKCFAAELLGEHGITLAAVREYAGESEPGRAGSGSGSVAGLYRWIAELEARGDLWIAEQESVGNSKTNFAVYAGVPPKVVEEALVQTPLVCIDVIRGQTFSQIRKRSDDQLAEGVAEIWLLDPDLKRAYTVTEAEGLRECKGEILRIANPPIEMDLRRIFD